MSPLPATRVWLAIGVGVAVTLLATSLGNWQTRRGDAKQAIEAQWKSAESSPPHAVRTRADATTVASALPRRVWVEGRFVPSAAVFVENRMLDGIVGFQVVMPLRLDDGGSILVNRGWLARDARDQAQMPSIATPTDRVNIEGLAVPRVPRLMELGPTPKALPGIWPNLDYDRYEQVAGFAVARFIVQQTSDEADGLRRAWPRPVTGIATHRGYALQWYALAALSAGLTLYFGGRALRRRAG